MSDPVAVIVWRDAKNDPPTGVVYRQILKSWGDTVTVGSVRSLLYGAVCDAWAELPAPPAADALTTDDLERIWEMCEWALCEDDPDDEQAIAAARLRRAIKEATHE